MTAVAVWRDGVMQSLVAYDPSQPRSEDPATAGQWVADGNENAAAGDDAEAKALYAQMLGMTPEQRAAFLAGLSPDMLKRVGAFAALGKATDGPIADIRNKAGEAMRKRGIDPGSVGMKPKGGKKKSAGKKKSGGGSKGGGSGKSSGGGGKKSSGGGGSKSSGGGGSSKKAAPKKKAPPKAPAPKPKPKPKPKAPPTVTPTRPRRPPQGPPRPPGTNPVGSRP